MVTKICCIQRIVVIPAKVLNYYETFEAVLTEFVNQKFFVIVPQHLVITHETIVRTSKRLEEKKLEQKQNNLSEVVI